MSNATLDCLIIGGGPAGLSAAVYMGRFLRNTLVVDSEVGRSTGRQRNENYLGFPRGVAVQRLRRLGRQQAERFGVRFEHGTIATLAREDNLICATGDCGSWRARTVILAAGVTDVWPALPMVHRFVGRSLFWCITCDGFRAKGRRVLLIGASDEAATTACQFLRYSKKLTFVDVSPSEGERISADKLDTLRQNDITVLVGSLERLVGANGQVRGAIVDGERCPVETVFSLLGSVPNTALAAQLGVVLDSNGFVCIDQEQRTNVPRFYAAGDISGPYAHQVASAVHEGAMAAQSANYDLYDEFQQ